jgi:CheY-like chemotaxis protein
MAREHDSTAPLRILLVDDDADIREAMQMTLELLLDYRPHEVITASNGAEALDELRRGPPDLVLLDLMMPIMSGSELLEVMRRDESLRDVPVVIVSAWSREAAGIAGAQGFLSKPIDMDDLLHVVQKYG